ncbi:hypothetical protein ABH909_003301 [Pseudomonas sp. BS3782 TE3695]|uniref:hypothetical protein n=1 Tax=Pseudomonas sp. BS3782 TE3695 TaxID=3349323 RepID=UPI003D20FF3D
MSRLFQEVYGDIYAQPDVYLPNMISQHNAEGRWQSILAMDGARVLGHAALCRDLPSNTAGLHDDLQQNANATRTHRYVDAHIGSRSAA